MSGPSDLAGAIAAARARYESSGDVAVLRESIRFGRGAVAELAGCGAAEGRAALELAVSLGALYSNHGGIGHLDEVLSQLECAEQTLPAGDPDLSSVYVSTSSARLQRYAVRGQRADLDAAIAAARRSIPATPAGHRSLASRHANLTGALRELYNVTGDLGDLDESISHGRAGVTALHDDSPGRPMVFATLSASLMARFARLEGQADLADAITFGRLAVASVPHGSMYRATALGILASALRLDFELSDRISSLTEAIDLQREDISLLPDGQPEAAVHLLNLAMALLLRFARVHSRPDLEAATGLLQRAVDLDYQLHQARCLEMLSKCMEKRSELLSADGQRQEATLAAAAAVENAQRALSLPGLSKHDRAELTLQLGTAWAAKWEVTGQQPDHARAAEIFGRALSLFEDDDPNAVACLVNLATLRLKPELTSPTPQGLAESAEMLRMATRKALPGGPVWARAAASLLAVLAAQHAEDPGSDPGEALELQRRLTGTPSAPPRLRVHSAAITGFILMSDHSELLAAMTYEQAIELLPAAVWHGLDRASQEAHLAEFTELALASSAAASQICVNATGRAVELLEQGRSIIWARMLELRHHDDLLWRDHPQLATRLRDIAAALDTTR